MGNSSFKPLLILKDLLYSFFFYPKPSKFDWIIISQSFATDFTIISKDKEFSDYKIKLLW